MNFTRYFDIAIFYKIIIYKRLELAVIIVYIFFIAEKAKNDEIPVLTCCQDKDHKRDTVFNVALTVGSHLEKIVEKVKSRHGIEHILVPITSTFDSRLSVIKSCCGNIIHTLLDRKSSFNGFEKVMYFYYFIITLFPNSLC